MSSSILQLNPISRVRRNHGLEHATIHVLNKQFPHMKLGGVSTPIGFIIIGEATTEDVAKAAIEALKRLRAGEIDLAFHPNCGTNYAIPGIFAGIAAWLGTLGSDKKMKSKLERLPLSILLATFAFILTRNLGPLVQKRVTVAGDPEGMELERVETSVRMGIRMHRVITKG
ncbi:MAG: DUF6391 domain-containing protein [Chloroflexota bacterium]|nr:DUF6391 domain-containing protein [Chloroflexota bacterium]